MYITREARRESIKRQLVLNDKKRQQKELLRIINKRRSK